MPKAFDFCRRRGWAALAALVFLPASATLAAETATPSPAAISQPQEAPQKSYDLAFTLKSDVMSNVSGGLKRGTVWLGHAEAALTMDLEKLLGWQGTTAYMHVHSDLGSKFNQNYVGAFSGVDNIEVADNTAQFFQAWLQKNYFQDRLSILAGLYAVDSEFYVTDTSGELLAPPYGMSNEIAQTGRKGPPIFPVGALGVRVKYTAPSNELYVMGALTDAVPGDSNTLTRTHFKLGDGTLAIVELGYTPQPEQDPRQEKQEPPEIFNKTAIGFWRYSKRFEDVDTGIDNRHPSQGVYLVAERTLYLEPQQPTQGLAGFVRFGTASERTNQVDWTASLGLRYHGLIPGRDDDIASIAVTVNHAGDHFRRANGGESVETDWELTYRAQVLPWLALQPDLQYIVNPSMDNLLDNACIIGFRAEAIF